MKRTLFSFCLAGAILFSGCNAVTDIKYTENDNLQTTEIYNTNVITTYNKSEALQRYRAAMLLQHIV